MCALLITFMALLGCHPHPSDNDENGDERVDPPTPMCGNNLCEEGEGTSTCYTDCVPGGYDAVPANYAVRLQLFPNAAVAYVQNVDSETIYCSGRLYGYYPNGSGESIYWRDHNPVPAGQHVEVYVNSNPQWYFVNGQHTITCRKEAP